MCGVQCFYVPRSNPDGCGVTIYCLDDYHKATSLSSPSPSDSAPTPPSSFRDVSIVSSYDNKKCFFYYTEYDGFGGWEAAHKKTGIAAQTKQ